jgi:hypothetical protein
VWPHKFSRLNDDAPLIHEVEVGPKPASASEFRFINHN